MKTENNFIDYEIDLPINGGTGKNIENAIVINELARDSYGEVECIIVEYIARCFDKKLNVIGEKLKTENGRYYDVMYIREDNESKDGFKFKLYFDITECLDRNNP